MGLLVKNGTWQTRTKGPREEERIIQVPKSQFTHVDIAPGFTSPQVRQRRKTEREEGILSAIILLIDQGVLTDEEGAALLERIES